MLDADISRIFVNHVPEAFKGLVIRHGSKRFVAEETPQRWRPIRPTPEWPTLKNVFIADTREKVQEAIRLARSWKVVGVDVESYGHDPKKEHPYGKAKCISVQIASTKGKMIFIPLWKDEDPQGRIELLFDLAEWLEEDRRQKVLHNAKYDMHVLANYGIELRGFLGDTQVMDYLAYNGQKRHGLKEAVRRCAAKGLDLGIYTGEDAVDYGDVFRAPRPLKRKGKNGETLYGKATWIQPLTEVIKTPEGVKKLIKYAVKDPRFTALIYKHHRAVMKAVPWSKARGNYFDYYEQFEVDYTKALFEMECEGAPIDTERLEANRLDIEQKIIDNKRAFLKEGARRQLGTEYLEKFNLGSGPQVSVLLYEKLKAPILGLTGGGKSGNQKPSTSGGTLERVALRRKKLAPIIEAILRHRRLTKLRKTYIIPIIGIAQFDHRVRSNYKQAATATMRLSSSTPNLQNIPAGKKDDEFKLRSSFSIKGLPKELQDKYVIADIDLSQIELRLTAHVTRDPKLLAILNDGLDQHLLAMEMLFPEVSKIIAGRPCTEAVAAEVEAGLGKAQYAELRRKAKVMNFGVIYGLGPQGYARQIGGSVDEGREVIAAYFGPKGFHVLKKGIKKVQRDCYRKGYVRTILGRYAVIPGIRSSDFAVKGSAERKAFAYKIQGGAGDLLKMSILLLYRCEKLRKMGVKMILQIHDELVFLIPKKHYDKAKVLIESYVSEPYKHFGFSGLVVPTPAKLGFGDNWLEAK